MAIDKNTVTKEAQKYIAKGQYDKAIAEWKKLLQELPDDPNIFNTIGDLCLKKNSKSEAVDAYKRAADMLASDGFTSKAIALYKKVLNIDNTVIDVHLALGDMHAEKGLTGNALENYKFVADYFTQKKQMAKALDIYQKMADLNSSNVAFRVKLGDMYAKEGMKEEAIAAYLAASDVHVSKNAFQEARQLFEKVLALDAGNKNVYHKAGIIYMKEGKFSEACKAFKPAFEKDPDNAQLADHYLEALEKAGKAGDLEYIINKVLAENPDRIDLREKLYRHFLSIQDLDKALIEAAALADNKIDAGQSEAAEAIYRNFVDSNPGFSPGRRTLAAFYLSVDRVQDAAVQFIRAAELLIEEGNTEVARTILVRVCDIAPDATEARELLNRLESRAPIEIPSAPELTQAITEPVVEKPIIPEKVIEEQAVFDQVATEQQIPDQDQIVAEQQIPDQIAEEYLPPQEAATSPAPARSPLEEDPAVIEACTEADVLIKYGLAAKALEQLEVLSSKFPESPRIRIKLRDLYHEAGNTDKAVLHARLAAALYIKFGREEEATALLESTLMLAPEHPALLSKLGRAPVGPVVAAPEEQPSTIPESIEHPAPPVMPASFAAELPGILPDHLDIDASFSPEQLASAAATPLLSELDEIAFAGLEAGIPSLEEPPVPAENTLPPLGSIPTPTESPSRLDVKQPPKPALDDALEALDQRQISQELAPEEPSFAAGTTASEVFEIPRSSPAFAPAPEPVREEMAASSEAEADVSEILAEAEFYFQQGLFDEAKKYYARIIALTPGDRRALERLTEISREEDETLEFSKLAEAVEGLEGYTASGAPAAELATSASDEEAVRSLMQEIHQLQGQQKPAPAPSPPKQEIKPPVAKTPEIPLKPAPPPLTKEAFPPPSKAAPAAVPKKPAAAPLYKPSVKSTDDDFFDLGAELQRETVTKAPSPGKGKPSDDFFDLAAELRDELSTIAVPKRAEATASEQSLDDIFEEFKKGAEQQSIKEDADTHYNLGVAYKEMGLLDDAIAEFIMTPEDEPKFVQSRYMLGLCYMEKSDYSNAIGEIQNALDYAETLGGGESLNQSEMHYDLGLACQGVGNTSGAIHAFQQVLELDPNNLDAVAKLKELHKGEFVSLEQLKDDIEKEISSKFLEEGIRIEREEKTKKTERVRN